ncbi:MAG: T9SS type A sorting domain-containing protein, partial [candidate division WOR-3 bacterium]
LPFLLIAQDSLNVRWLGAWPFGTAQKMSAGLINGHRYVMLTAGGGILILNVDDPTQPVKVSQIITRSDRPHTYFTSNLLFVAERSFGLKIYDLQNPAEPVLLGGLDAIYSVNEVFVKGNYAYITDSYKLRIIDISNPYSPFEIGSCNILEPPCYSATGIAVKGDYAYCVMPFTPTTFGGELVGINIFDPAHPYRIYDTTGVPNLSGAKIYGNYLFVFFLFGGGTMIFDISEPGHPVYCCEMGGSGKDCEVYENYLYFPDYDSINGYGFGIYDITDIHSPIKIGWCPLPDTVWCYKGVSYLNGYVFLSHTWGGLRSIDATDPQNPYEIGHYQTPGCLRNVFVRGNYAYLCSENMLNIVDISNPANCQEVGSLAFENNSNMMYLGENYAYVTCGEFENGKLNVIDISIPTNPVKLGECYIPNCYGVWGVWARDSFVYVADHTPGLTIVNVANPQMPYVVSTYDSVVCPFYDIAGAGDYVYMAGVVQHGGLSIINVHDPLHPFRTSFLECNQGNLTLDNNRIYIAGNDTLFVIDVTNPYLPMLIGCLPQAYFYDIDASGNIATGVRLDASSSPIIKLLSVLDVSNPNSITELGYYDAPPGEYYGVDVVYKNSYIYIAQWFLGLHIYQYYGEGISEEKASPASENLQIKNLKEDIEFTYYLKNPSEVKISFIDILGRVLERQKEYKQSGIHTGRIDKQRFSSGVYFLMIETNDWTCVKKVVVIR